MAKPIVIGLLTLLAVVSGAHSEEAPITQPSVTTPKVGLCLYKPEEPAVFDRPYHVVIEVRNDGDREVSIPVHIDLTSKRPKGAWRGMRVWLLIEPQTALVMWMYPVKPGQVPIAPGEFALARAEIPARRMEIGECRLTALISSDGKVIAESQPITVSCKASP